MNPPPQSTDLAALLESREFLRNLARSLVADPERAEDLAQEAWVRALERPPGRTSAMKSWLAKVLRNLAVNQGLREAQRPAVEREAARPQALEEEERDLELEGAVLDAVRSLRQPYRSAVYLRYYRGLSPSEISAELAVPEATVKTRLRRGLELLRADLDRRHEGDRRQWCSALVALALPELIPAAAAPLPLAALAKGALKGILVMNKPVTAAVTALTLVAIASVAFIATRDDTSKNVEVPRDGALEPALVEASEPVVAPRADELPQEPAPVVSERAEVQRPAASAASTTAPASSGLLGRVVDEAGSPVAGAQVRALEQDSGIFLAQLAFGGSGLDDSAATVSAADGTFRLPVEEDGPLELVVNAAGFAPFRKEVTGYYDLTSDVGDLALETGVVLSGSVVTPDGKPVAGAELRTTPGEQSANVIPFMGALQPVAAVTDAEGRFALDSHAVGAWSLEVQTAAYPTRTVSGRTDAPGERVDDIEVVLDEGATIAGRITGLPEGRASELWVRAGLVPEENGSRGGVSIRLFDAGGGMFASERVARVQPDGSFELRGLAPELQYRLRAFDVESSFGGRARTDTAEAEAGEDEVELAWSPGASVRIQVVDAETGRPLEDFVVSAGFDMALPLTDESGPLVHHPDGLVTVEDLRVGAGRESANVTIEVAAEGYAPWSRNDVSVPRDRELDLGVVRLERVPLVRVTVTDREGRPVAGARVTLQEEAPASVGGGRSMRLERRMRVTSGGGVDVGAGAAEREAVTDEAGLAVLSSLPGRRAAIAVDARRFADFASEPFDLPAIGDLARTVQLARGGVAEVQVLDEAGEPLPGARVEHRPQEAGAGDILHFDMGGTGRVTDSEGSVFFRNLAQGAHEFRLAEEGSGGFIMDGGGGMRVQGISFSSGDEAPWTELWIEDGATEELVLSKSFQGSVLGMLSENGAALADAELLLLTDPDDPMGMLGGFADAPRTRTNRDGEFELEGVAPGNYTLVVKHPTRVMPHREELEVLPGRNRLDLDLDVAIIAGIVRDPAGDPIAGARVEVERVRGEGPEPPRRMMVFAATVDAGSGASGGDVTIQAGGEKVEPVETDAQGRYLLRGVPTNGKLRVTAKADEYSPGRSDVLELSQGEERTDVDLEMLQGGSVAVTVTQGGAAPSGRVLVNGVRLEDGEPAGDPNVQVADADGRVSFRDLAPGLWRFSGNSMGGSGRSPEPVEIEVVAGEAQPLTLVMP